MKKKVLVFIGASYVSGLEIVTLHLINELIQSGYDVRCVINGWNDGVFKGKLNENKIPWYEVKLGWVYITKPLWTIDTLIHWPLAYLKCKKILKEFKPDVCHFCGFAHVIMLFPLLKNQNCVYNLQEPHQPTKKHIFIYRLLNKRIKIFTAVSNYISNVLIELKIPAEKIKLIYNGVPLVTHPADAKFQEHKTKAIAIIGQIVPWKGHETLINAVSLLSESFLGKFIVCIYGNDENEYAKKLKEIIKEKKIEHCFQWMGFVKRQAAIYADVDLVVVPSLSQEPCSLTILESMSRGKAVIASDRGGNIELIKDNINGLIFKAGDPDSLANCIRKILDDDKFAKGIASCAFQQASQFYTAKKMEEGYLKLYDDLPS